MMNLKASLIRNKSFIIIALVFTQNIFGQNEIPIPSNKFTTTLPSPKYQLVWADEFDSTALDTTKWNYRGLGQRRQAFNVKNTVQFDEMGNLVLTTRKVGNEIHTAMIGTQGKFETTFGYFECRVKIQSSHGHWSAFWLQSPTISHVGDTKKHGTEIDIYECFEPQQSVVVHNIHWDGYGAEHKHQGSGKKKIDGLLDGYHTFGLEWTPEEYIFYIDGEKNWRTDQAISHRDQYIILSLEVGDKQQAVVEKNPNFWDHVYYDYVRVYKKR
jgi:beta-glucanase (GH16 family)